MEAASKGKTGVGVNSTREVKMYGTVNGDTVLKVSTPSTTGITVVWSPGVRAVVIMGGVMGVSRICNVMGNGRMVPEQMKKN